MRLDADHIHATLAELPVRVGENPQPDRVQVAAPGDVRARRFEAVFVCGLQEREFPRRSAPDAFLPDTDRAELAKASGLRLPLHEDYLARERYLFYVCASRAERLLVLSSRYCDEEGNPESPSFFLDDARAVFAGGLEDVEHRRSLADVTWSLEQAPTDAEWERAVARQGPRRAPQPVASISTPAALSALDARDVVSAGALEAYAGCPVKWLVEKVLRPDALEPDPEPMVRGAYAHSVLEATLKGLEEATGSMEVTRQSLAQAEGFMQAALTDLRGEFRLSPNQVRVRAAVHQPGVRPPALPPLRGRARERLHARAPGAGVRLRRFRPPAGAARRRHHGARPDRPGRHQQRARRGDRLQERQGR